MVSRGTDIDRLQSNALAFAECQCEILKVKKMVDASTQYEQQNGEQFSQQSGNKSEDGEKNSFEIAKPDDGQNRLILEMLSNENDNESLNDGPTNGGTFTMSSG